MDTNEKMLERVRALLAKADSTDFPAEAETFRAKADELMTQYAIAQWQVDAAQNGVGARAMPEKVMMDFHWFYASNRHSDLWSMFLSVARHCRVVVATRGHGVGDSSLYEIPVIGLKSDISYFDLLFTHLMLQMGKELEPQVDAGEGLGANVYRLRQAGQPWPRITEQIFKAGLVSLTAGELKKLNTKLESRGLGTVEAADVKWEDLKSWGMGDEVWMSIKNRLANANRKYVKDNGLQEDRNYVKPQVYQRSFAYGFVQQVSTRLREMERANRTAYDKQHKTGSMDLVVRDIYDQALALYEEMWPTPEVKATKGRGRALTRSVRMSGKAMDAGREAGAKADLSARPGTGLKGRKEIDR